ncbi:zincin [Trichodelitschia bisporula]|uniref:deuterolysin n=1 Tax=Trichodelitschia bisporula TaxID=703511 RepID=A0A6G1I4D8_9PEZI|nr:zincin [Trichodelitschia bisporula]
MHSFKILLGALPFGLAAQLVAEPFRSQIETSPLHIELQNSELTGHVRAVITNRGETALFSTWQNPLSTDQLARKLYVTIGGDPVQFLNPEGLPVGAPEEYESLPAGVSITREINIASHYELQPSEQYEVQAGGLVPFRLGDQRGDAVYETNVLSFTAPDEIPVRHVDGITVEAASNAEAASNFIYGACEDQVLNAKVKRSIPIAAAMAKKASEETAAGKHKDAFVAYFKVDNEANRKKVADRYAAIYKTLTSETGPIKIACRATCTGFYAIGAAWTEPTTGKTEFCPTIKQYPDDAKKCERMNLPGVIMHELSHSSLLYKPSTGDQAQGPQQCKALAEKSALNNADTYNLYGQSVFLDTVC